MDVVDLWTGRRASALRASSRMTNEAFAAHLGAAVRTVATWEAKPDMVLSATMQEVLDSALKGADADVQRRFEMILKDPTPESVQRSTTRPPPEAAVEASQQAWRRIRQHLTEEGIGLAARTADLYDADLRVGHVPALSTPGWLPQQPVLLDDVTLHWIETPPEPRLSGREPEARTALPLRSPGNAFTNYTSAIRYLRPPALFENRSSYRLLDLDWAGGRGAMSFGLSTFFDKLDVGEVLAHEAGGADLRGSLGWGELPFRTLLGDVFDLSDRAVNPGISTLTIRRDTATGEGTFFLLRRDPSQVTNGRHYSLLPAGEFQPASISPRSLVADLDIWRNMVREYAEELLGQPEHDGSGGTPVDYEVWPFYRDMTSARTAGAIRPYILGVIVDALSLNASIATVTVIDDHVFDTLFRARVSTNPEGEVVTSLDEGKSVHGLPFTEETVTRLTTQEPLGQTSAACLTLAWNHRAALLGLE
ncbi:hypothetical protein [Kribbella sp. CA-293567]|uniref:hypothetical protein n=1 Tax=Kribbella sp. CA-293567 TaxID=3002436 RepID=UPI0022DD74B5|nr:hypothetical protein [Kribbella sp. CA-293567]WBQ06251.1 hypothetical protein OX958_05485 [Kribbella sp. CA-293567]